MLSKAAMCTSIGSDNQMHVEVGQANDNTTASTAPDVTVLPCCGGIPDHVLLSSIHQLRDCSIASLLEQNIRVIIRQGSLAAGHEEAALHAWSDIGLAL